MAAFGGEQNAESLPAAVGAHLPDIAAQMTRCDKAGLLNVLHRCDDGGDVLVRELAQEFLHWSCPARRSVISPAAPAARSGRIIVAHAPALQLALHTHAAGRPRGRISLMACPSRVLTARSYWLASK